MYIVLQYVQYTNLGSKYDLMLQNVLHWRDNKEIFLVKNCIAQESIPPAYVAWRASTKNLFLLGSQPPQIV